MDANSVVSKPLCQRGWGQLGETVRRQDLKVPCAVTDRSGRNLVFPEINTLKVDPLMPYHDRWRPYVRYWFSSSEGATVHSFCQLISEANQDRLLEEGEACIAYTHFGNGFWRDGCLDPEFTRLMRRLANLPGWFVPASRLLDYLGEVRGCEIDGDRRRLDRMQWRWLLHKLRHSRS